MNSGSLMTHSNAAVAYVNNQRASEAGVQTLKSTVSVHELVARLFVGPPPQSLPRYALPSDRFVVHHKNGNHLDNCAANLLWILNSMHTRVHRLGMSYAETLATFEIDKQTHVQLAAQMEISPEEQEEQDEEARVEIAREILREEQEVEQDVEQVQRAMEISARVADEGVSRGAGTSHVLETAARQPERSGRVGKQVAMEV